MIELGIAASTRAGETASADRCVVRVLHCVDFIAVVDGVGHGASAAAAAEIAIGTLGEHAGEPLDALFARCHAALRSTRGVVVSAATLDARTSELCWLGIGNVEAVRVPVDARAPSTSLVLRGGIVGHRLPRLLPETLPIAHGDALVFATDGVCSGFRTLLPVLGPAQHGADRILASCRKSDDDALVLVARYLGRGP
ncbi:MAG: stage II sporulation protein E (SpoIIE) [Planctomycetota bacterium]|nr:MAG: stage II sporulation protein E (SpoIIE) [Planctomycetota bacterium]